MNKYEVHTQDHGVFTVTTPKHHDTHQDIVEAFMTAIAAGMGKKAGEDIYIVVKKYFFRGKV